MMQRDPKKRPTAAEILKMPSIAEHVARRRAAYRIVEVVRYPLGSIYPHALALVVICYLEAVMKLFYFRSGKTTYFRVRYRICITDAGEK